LTADAATQAAKKKRISDFRGVWADALKGGMMKIHTAVLLLCVSIALGALTGCSGASSKSPDVSETIRRSLDQSGLKDVSVSEDRDKGVVTLNGHVPYEADKIQAETVAKSEAGQQIVANEIAIIPPGVEDEAKAVNSDLDKGIDKNLDAALIQARLNKGVKYDIKNGVVTLKGEVNSQTRRSLAESIASKVPNVHQVVNELEVKNQKATSTN
jgi:hyperosmotically inducible periplasmic protein